ncbi:sialidase family protein [Longispora albida]|uniref:sialidase family protein n=1 Tax=Longispora albida TaxID=203523 RepID=UPI0003622828|nr:hypothetical protein [Longispora albida]
MRKLITGFAAALTVTAVALAPSGVATAAPLWNNPTCSTITGTSGITYTKNAGATLTPTATSSVPITYTWGLVALDVANTLIATREYTDPVTLVQTSTVLRSTNAGCSWSTIATLPGGWIIKAVAGKGGRAYLYSDSGTHGIYRVSGTTVTALADPTTDGITGLGVDPSDGLHVMLGDNAGQLFESYNGGASWTITGSTPPGVNAYDVYDTAIDPKNPWHAVVGTGKGAFVTYDGGGSWTSSTGLDLTPGGFGATVMTVVGSPYNSNVFYAMAIDIDQADAHTNGNGRHLYRSTNGGQSFTPIVESSASVLLTNGLQLWPSASNSTDLWFVYGTPYNAYGTDLFKYSASTGQVTKTHNNEHEITAIAFNPTYPGTMYLGLAKEPGGS